MATGGAPCPDSCCRGGAHEGGRDGRDALALPGEGSRAYPLLSRRSLRLGGEEGRGESGVGLLPTEGGGCEWRICGRHPETRPRGIGRGLQGGRISARGLQQLRHDPQGGRSGGVGQQGALLGGVQQGAAQGALLGCDGGRIRGGGLLQDGLRD